MAPPNAGRGGVSSSGDGDGGGGGGGGVGMAGSRDGDAYLEEEQEALEVVESEEAWLSSLGKQVLKIHGRSYYNVLVVSACCEKSSVCSN